MNNGRRGARRNVAVTTLGAGLVMCTMHACSCERGTTGKGPVGAESANAAAVKASPTDSVEGFEGLRDRLVADWLAETPTAGRALGLHEFDGKLRDHSKEGLLRAVARNKEYREKLAKVPPESLNEDLRLDLALAKLMVDEELFRLEDLEEPWKNPRFYEDLFAVNDYVMRPYAPLPERAQRLLQHEEAALKEVPHVVANLRLPLSKVVAQVASKNYAGFAIYLRGDVAKTVAEVKDSAFQSKFVKTNEALAQEADKLSLWLAEQAKAGDSSHVLGRERFEKYLRVFEGLSMPLAEFKRMGEENLAKNQAAYEALRKVVSPTRPKASELLKLATELVDSSRKFIQDKHIVTMPSADTAVVKETPPYARWNSASLEVSGPFDPHKSAFYFITLPDPSWPLKEQEEYVFSTGSLISTTVHEVYPGHFVQGRWAERAPTRLQKIYASYSFVEGWAHYVEEMMLEVGFASTDQARLGQLEDALLRNCRFVASVGIHTEGMTMEQAEERFTRDCHIAKAEARAQAIRGTFDPGYFAYTLGKLEILQLRDEAKKKLGPKFSLQRFHDALLAQGSPPVALIREKVLRVLQ